jgi:putative transposase
MPRSARIDSAGVLHHVIIRGIEGRMIFMDDSDREGFLMRLGTLLEETQTCCYAWALMPNHIHLLLRTGNVSLSNVMARLLTGYVVTFNKRHQRHGHLFQNRYKSIICQEDLYCTELIRYIHLNPLRASLVADFSSLNRYPHAGHSAVMGEIGRPWQDVDHVLSLFGTHTQEARKHYLTFVEKGVEQGRRPDLIGGGVRRSYSGWQEITEKGHHERSKGDERILGSSNFVQKILNQSDERLQSSVKIKQAGHTLDTVAEEIARLFDLKKDSLFTKTKEKHIVAARSLLCYVAINDLGISATDLARRFCMTQPAITYAAKRGRNIAQDRKYALERNL